MEAQKKGLFVEYRLADEDVLRFVHAMRALAEARLAEIGEITHAYLKARGALERVSSKELMQRVRDGEVTVLDVRPAEEYRAGHIPGARSVPVSELRKRLAELPKNREIVAYCRGPQCVMAVEAVELLRKEGFRAHRMEEGVVDWRARGWRIDAARPRECVRGRHGRPGTQHSAGDRRRGAADRSPPSSAAHHRRSCSRAAEARPTILR